jgi:hypothetical protein
MEPKKLYREREFGTKMDIERERGIWVNLDIGFRSKEIDVYS